MIPVKVKEIAYDVMMNPVVLLVDEAEVKALPIWVGPFEAHAIAFALQGIRLDRPLTHDLLKNICDRLEAKLSMIIINDRDELILSKSTYGTAVGNWYWIPAPVMPSHWLFLRKLLHVGAHSLAIRTFK